jgi:hypothetical protein
MGTQEGRRNADLPDTPERSRYVSTMRGDARRGRSIRAENAIEQPALANRDGTTILCE